MTSGAWAVRRVVRAVDRHRRQSDAVRTQIQSAIMFVITAALYVRITLKHGRVEQSNFDSYLILTLVVKATVATKNDFRLGSRPCYRAI